MIHTLISQLALDRAKTILENSDFWSGPAAAKTSAEAVTVLRALGGDPPKEEAPKTGQPKAPRSGVSLEAAILEDKIKPLSGNNESKHVES